MTAAEQITLTADELDTFAEVLGHEPTLAQEPRPGRHGS